MKQRSDPLSGGGRRLLLAAALSLATAIPIPPLGLSGTALAESDLKSQAEEAFRNDRYPEAIDLYKKIVSADPADTFSLKRLGLLCSWENRLDESIAAYRQAAAQDPKDEEARRELAKVQSWAGEYPEAEQGYRSLLAERPDDATLKLSLAEVLAWRGKYAEARSIYQPLIAAHDHAIPAALGMGNCAAWEGNLEEAARWYRQVLKADPNNEAATLGLARIHHWQGKDRMAVMEVDQASEKFPDSKEAKKLQSEVKDPLRPAVTPSFDRILDTDTNDLAIGRLGYNLHTDPQSTLDLVYAHYDATFVCDVAGHCPGVVAGALPTDPVDEPASTEGHSIYGVFNTRFSDILFLNARLGADRQDRFDGDSLTRVAGSGSFDYYPTMKWGYGATLARESLFDTARIIDNRLRIHAATARSDYRFAERWRWRASYEHGWFNDDNQRNVFNTSVEVRLPVPRTRFRLTYAFRRLDYQKDLDSGYFDPQKFMSHLLTASAAGDFYHRTFYYAADLTSGVQSFTASGEDSGTDTVFGYELLAGWNIRHHLAFEATYGRTNYAQQVATGFESHHYGFLLRLTF